MKKIDYHLTGMHCEHCIESVRRALQKVPGVRKAEVRLNEAQVEFDESLCRPAELINAIRSAGTFDVLGFAPAQP